MATIDPGFYAQTSLLALKLSTNGPVPVGANAAAQKPAVLGDPSQDSTLMLDQVDLEHVLQNRPVTLPGNAKAALLAQLSQYNPNLGAPTVAPQPAPVPSAATQLSSTAQWVGQALHQAEDLQAPTHLQGQAPLQNKPGVDVKQLTQQLQQALDRSGLFYESHLKAWAQGQRSLEQLRQEPQNQVPSPPPRPSASGAPTAPPQPTATPPNTAAVQLLPLQLDTLDQKRLVWQGELWAGQALHWEVEAETPATPQRGPHTGQSSTSSPATPPGHTGSTNTAAPEPSNARLDTPASAAPRAPGNDTPALQNPPPGPGTAAPVASGAAQNDTTNAQTAAQTGPNPGQANTGPDGKPVAWQGELWGGQKVRWDVQEAPHRKPSNGATPETKAWQTRLQVEFPGLGAVQAQIRLFQGRVQVQLRAQDPQATAALQAGQTQLDDALAASGSPMESFGVRHDGPPT